ncbi:hypothetical protein MNBD_NITROSPINAE04-704 [hydrothermal vent metagenome]|uniref:Uncharacterized protein n=1 Tax=hydrothermal vent metagenome TaxID=652676 RepID=A0A3B1D2C9_9ZZZZ
MGGVAKKRFYSVTAMFAVAAIIWAGCGLQYAGEEFSLTIGGDGSGTLKVLYKNFGSKEKKSHLRKKDLALLRDTAANDQAVIDAKAKGVSITKRRLDFINYAQNGYVEARAASYKKIFDVFTHYKLEVSDKIYITPVNGTVHRAKLSEPGKIVIKDKRYAFAWPLDTKDISFKASYKIEGASFNYEFQKKFDN